MDQLRAMQVFSRVVELQSFTKAAHALAMPKAAVTGWVQALEAHVGVKLLHRTTRRMGLTEDGAAYLDGARRLLSDAAELDASVKRAGAIAQGRLRIDVPAALGRHVLAPALPSFCARYPQISVEIGCSDRHVDLLLEGVDCVIRGGAVLDEALVGRKLGAFDSITCAAPKYLQQMGTPGTLRDLTHQKHLAVSYISTRTGRPFPLDFADSKGRTRSIQLPSSAAANDADVHAELICAGLGLGQLPRTKRVASLLKSGRLKQVLHGYGVEPLVMHILYLRSRHLAARLRAFVDWFVELYAGEF